MRKWQNQCHANNDEIMKQFLIGHFIFFLNGFLLLSSSVEL